MLRRILYFINDFILLFYCLGKVLPYLKLRKIDIVKKTKTLYILGNGPSLSNVETYLKNRSEVNLCTVNFAVISDLFMTLRPEMHVLSDDIFFMRPDLEKVKLLYDMLNTKVDWDITIYVYHSFPKEFVDFFKKNKHIKVVRYISIAYNNHLSIFDSIKFRLFNIGLLSAGSQNVVVSCIYLGIRLGYTNINLLGVEHSWLKLTKVGDDNIVYLQDEHFYGTTERPWVNTDGTFFKLHDLLMCWYYAFSAYHILQKYAEFKGVKIINITKGSFIDAFEKK